VDESQLPIDEPVGPEPEGGNPYVPPSAPLVLTREELLGVTESSPAPNGRTTRRFVATFVALLVASLVGTLAILPFSWALVKSADPPLVPELLLPVLMMVTVAVELVISAVSIIVGQFLGGYAKLGHLFVPFDASNEPSRDRRLWKWVAEPLAAGMILGGLTWAFAMAFNARAGAEQPGFTLPGPWAGLLASIGAGIREEIWLRFGFMTFLAALGCAIARHFSGAKSEQSAAIITMANIAAALMFAAIHIPQAHAFLGLSKEVLVFVIVGNGVPGFVFGWLYWRRGLVPAMVAHFGLDLVLKVILPLVAG
jgi:hypothetical protein